MFSGSTWKDTHAHAQPCAEKLSLNWAQIKSCVDGPEGEGLYIENWRKTDDLVPKHTFIPWITINGGHTDDLQKQSLKHLSTYLCEHYLNGIPECK